jgi:hypothetical protein
LPVQVAASPSAASGRPGRPQSGDEGVDIGLGRCLGHRHHQSALERRLARIEPPERYAAEDAARRQLAHDRTCLVHVEHKCELIEQRPVDQPQPVQPAEPLRGVERAVMVQLRQLSEAGFAEQGHVDGESERAQHRAGADVRCRLLAADVLFARRQCEHEAALAFGVDGHAREPPGHLPDIFVGAGEKADIGAAELQPDPDRLALADDDVGAHLPGTLQHPQGDRLGDDGDQQRAFRVSPRGQLGKIGAAAENVRILEDEAARLFVDPIEQSFGVAILVIARRFGLEPVAGEARHRPRHRHVMRMEA